VARAAGPRVFDSPPLAVWDDRLGMLRESAAAAAAAVLEAALLETLLFFGPPVMTGADGDEESLAVVQVYEESLSLGFRDKGLGFRV